MLKALQFFILSIVLSGSILPQERIITVSPSFSEKNISKLNSIEFKEMKRPKIALVFSGGGARGIAHLGVLETLEKNNIPIDFIVGTSIGGVIGGLYASGYTTEELLKLIDTTDWNYVLSFTEDTERKNLYLTQKQNEDKNQLTVRFDGLTPIIPSSVSSGQRLTEFINRLTLQALYHPVYSFDDLKVPFRSVATDLISGQKIVFKSGNLSEALRASISVPLLFNPLKKDTLELIDGGLVSNIPVEVAKELGADIIIVVNTVSPLRTPTQLKNPWEVADQIINIMAQKKNQEALDNATIVITPDLGNYPTSDFEHLKFTIQQGIYATQKQINAIKDSIRNKERQLLLDSSPLSNFIFQLDSVSFNIPSIDTSVFTSELSTFESGSTVTVGQIRSFLTQVYRTGWFRDVHAHVVLKDKTADLIIEAIPNPIVKTITVSGNSIIGSNELLIELNSIREKPFNYPNFNSSIEKILTIYRNSGFSLARIQTIQFDSLDGRLTLEINEGIIHKIYLKGKVVSRDWVVRRELGFSDGNIFTVSKGKQALTNLYGTNLFEQVIIDVAYEDSLPTINIQLEEKPTDVSRVGFRADNERNLQPTIAFRNENVFGTAMEVGASFAGGLRNRKYIFDFQANRIFNTYFTLNLDIYHDLRDIYTYATDPLGITEQRFYRAKTGEYRQIQYGLVFQLGQQVERLGTLNIEYKLESDEVKFIGGTGYTPERFTLQALRLSSTIDSRNQYPFARTGSLTNFSWETATSTFKNLVGDIGYSKIYFEYETNISYELFTLTPKIVVGFGDQTLPLTQQFSLGGEDSFFGLREYDARGRQIFLTSIEARTLFPFKAIWDTYFRIRYDFGNIWPNREDIRIRDFHHGIGVALSLDTPIGLANFSVGRSFYIRRDLLNQPLTLGSVIAYFSFGYPIL